MDKLIITIVTIFSVAAIVLCLIESERWAKKNDQPRLIDLIKGKKK